MQTWRIVKRSLTDSDSFIKIKIIADHRKIIILPLNQRQVNVVGLKTAERILLYALEWCADKVAIFVIIKRGAAHVHLIHGVATRQVKDPLIDISPFYSGAEVPVRHIEGIRRANPARDRKSSIFITAVCCDLIDLLLITPTVDWLNRRWTYWNSRCLGGSEPSNGDSCSKAHLNLSWESSFDFYFIIIN